MGISFWGVSAIKSVKRDPPPRPHSPLLCLLFSRENLSSSSVLCISLNIFLIICVTGRVSFCIWFVSCCVSVTGDLEDHWHTIRCAMHMLFREWIHDQWVLLTLSACPYYHRQVFHQLVLRIHSWSKQTWYAAFKNGNYSVCRFLLIFSIKIMPGS